MPDLSAAELVASQIEALARTSPRWLSFQGDLEQSFEMDGAVRRSRRMWLEGLISIAIFDAFFLLDKLVLGDIPWSMVWMELGIVTPMALLVNETVRRNPRRWIREGTVALATCVIAAVYLWLQHGRHPVASAYAAVGVIVTAAFANVVMRLRLRYAVTCSLLILSMGLAFLLLDRMQTSTDKVLGGTLTTIAVGITLMANFSLEREERLGYLMRRRSELQSQELATTNAALARLSALDGLTGLPNRHSYDERFRALWREAGEVDAPLSAVLVDIDHFKVLNDVRGHLYGDEVLRRMGSLLLQALRGKADFAARYGGEEFVVLLPGTGRESALMVAERIRQLVEVAGSPALESVAEQPMMWVTVSCGVSTCVSTEEYRPDELVEAADRALYTAKTMGRNMVQWQEMDLPGAVPRFVPAMPTSTVWWTGETADAGVDLR